MLKLYNTLTRKKENFVPLQPPLVTMYVCGPTVYNFAHIGNLRTYVFVDLLRRVLEYNGFQIRQVENITDVGHLTSDADSGEDKLEKGAQREKKTVWEIAQFYTTAFQKDMADLNIKEPTIWCKATDHIQLMIALVLELERKGLTYRIAGDGIYFDTSKVKDYGKLAKLDIEGLKKGERITFNPQKRHPTDFALWKFAPEGEKRQMEWSSPWGEHTFPGWHLECSAMSMKYLSQVFDEKGNFCPQKFETIDIHTGGVDHIQVHHTNEIAQSEAATGKQFVKYWLHGEFLLISQGRMGKSEGNFITLETLKERNFDPLAYRYFLLNAHYRTQLNFTWEALEGAAIAYKNLQKEVSLLGEETGEADKKSILEFKKRIDNDLNLPQALAWLWEILRSEAIPAVKKATVLEMDQVLGLRLDSVKPFMIPEKIRQLAEMRERARRKKDFKTADELREEIKNLGYEIEDTREGYQILPL